MCYENFAEASVHYRDFALAARAPRAIIVNQVPDGKKARFCRYCCTHLDFLARIIIL